MSDHTKIDKFSIYSVLNRPQIIKKMENQTETKTNFALNNYGKKGTVM